MEILSYRNRLAIITKVPKRGREKRREERRCSTTGFEDGGKEPGVKSLYRLLLEARKDKKTDTLLETS